MTQGELFADPPTAAPLPAQEPAARPAGEAFVDSQALRRQLRRELGLWVDPFTAQYLGRALSRGVSQIEFIAADAHTGRSAFRTLPASALRRMLALSREGEATRNG